MTDEMGIRGEAIESDLLAAVHLAIAAQGISSKERAFDLIAWIMEHHELGENRPVGVKVFMESLKATKAKAPAQRGIYTQSPGTAGVPRVRPENIC
jgi:hypothetical protein